jgi:hypothetical protein
MNELSGIDWWRRNASRKDARNVAGWLESVAITLEKYWGKWPGEESYIAAKNDWTDSLIAHAERCEQLGLAEVYVSFLKRDVAEAMLRDICGEPPPHWKNHVSGLRANAERMRNL